MNNKEIKELTNLAKRKLSESVTKKEALETFVKAGILDKKGQFTESYSELAAVVKR